MGNILNKNQQNAEITQIVGIKLHVNKQPFNDRFQHSNIYCNTNSGHAPIVPTFGAFSQGFVKIYSEAVEKGLFIFGVKRKNNNTNESRLIIIIERETTFSMV